MQGMVVLRSVRRRDKPLALGVSCAIIGLLAHLLGHLFYMLISCKQHLLLKSIRIWYFHCNFGLYSQNVLYLFYLRNFFFEE